MFVTKSTSSHFLLVLVVTKTGLSLSCTGVQTLSPIITTFHVAPDHSGFPGTLSVTTDSAHFDPSLYTW